MRLPAMFVCLSVCQSVSQSVSKITQKRVHGFCVPTGVGTLTLDELINF